MTTDVERRTATRDDMRTAFSALLEQRLIPMTPDDARGHKGDRGGMAALRRGLARTSGFSAERCQIVAPFVLPQANERQEQAMYDVASLYAMHPHHAAHDRTTGHDYGLGGSLARVRNRPDGTEDSGVVRRFILTLEADAARLPERLRTLITLLDARVKGAPIDYNRLFADILAWNDDDHHVQRRWARGFFAHRADTAATTETDEDTHAADAPAPATED